MRTMTDLKLSICYGNMAACLTTVCRPMLFVDDVDTAGVTFDTHELDSSNHHISFGYTFYVIPHEGREYDNEWKRAKRSTISPTGSGNPFM